MSFWLGEAPRFPGQGSRSFFPTASLGRSSQHAWARLGSVSLARWFVMWHPCWGSTGLGAGGRESALGSTAGLCDCPWNVQHLAETGRAAQPPVRPRGDQGSWMVQQPAPRARGWSSSLLPGLVKELELCPAGLLTALQTPSPHPLPCRP